MSGKGVADVVKGFNKKYGEKTALSAREVEVTERVPTGIFPLDLALGGGIPRRRLTVFWGQESSNKTNVCLSTIKQHMLLYPDLTCVFVDLEHTFDPIWAEEFGVDVENLLVISPDYAEQAVDIIQELIMADGIGLIVVDSLAVMTTQKDFDNTSETQRVGGVSLLTTTFIKKLTVAMSKAQKMGNWPTVVCVNQMRYKIGQMFGNPETQSGGKALQHGVALSVKLYAKPVKDPKVDVDIPVRKETTFTVTKHKMSVVATNGKFEMVVYPHKGLKVGETDDWNTIGNHLKDLGFLEKGMNGKGWIMLQEQFGTLDECRERLVNDPKYGSEVRQAIIERVAKDNGIKVVGQFQ